MSQIGQNLAYVLCLVKLYSLILFFQVEEDLLAEKYKIKRTSDNLNQIFEDMINMVV